MPRQPYALHRELKRQGAQTEDGPAYAEMWLKLLACHPYLEDKFEADMIRKNQTIEQWVESNLATPAEWLRAFYLMDGVGSDFCPCF